MPLMMLPMAPGVELNLGNSLIPITRHGAAAADACWKATTAQALPYIAAGRAGDAGLLPAGHSLGRRPVQHESGAVPRKRTARSRPWLKHLMRDREDTPGVPQAVLCGVLILIVRFFMSFSLLRANEFVDFRGSRASSPSWSWCSRPPC